MSNIGSIHASPGTIETGRVLVGESRDGSDVGLPVCIVNGDSAGKTLYIQAASDGNELNGVGVIRELVPRLDASQISGTILIVGIANMHAFQVAEHRNPIDDTKLNRVYPGDEYGTSSERIAAKTFEAVQKADLVLDLHQGSTSRMIDETRVRCGQGHHLHDKCLELAKAFNCGYIFDRKGPNGQLARVAPEKGIPAIDPELGGSIGISPESTQIGLQGINNVLKSYGFLSEESVRNKQVRARGFKQYNAPTGGLVKFEADLGNTVESGDKLFSVTNVFGDEKGKIVADSEGIFWRTRRLPQVATGEYVCSVGTRIDTY